MSGTTATVSGASAQATDLVPANSTTAQQNASANGADPLPSFTEVLSAHGKGPQHDRDDHHHHNDEKGSSPLARGASGKEDAQGPAGSDDASLAPDPAVGEQSGQPIAPVAATVAIPGATLGLSGLATAPAATAATSTATVSAPDDVSTSKGPVDAVFGDVSATTGLVPEPTRLPGADVDDQGVATATEPPDGTSDTVGSGGSLPLPGDGSGGPPVSVSRVGPTNVPSTNAFREGSRTADGSVPVHHETLPLSATTAGPTATSVDPPRGPGPGLVADSSSQSSFTALGAIRLGSTAHSGVVAASTPTTALDQGASSLDIDGLYGSISRPLTDGNGSYTVIVAMHPPELGHLQAVVSLNGNDLQVAITAQTQSGHEALANATDALKNQLAAEGST